MVAVAPLLLLRHLRQCPHPRLPWTPTHVMGAENSVAMVVVLAEAAPPMAVVRVKAARDAKVAKAAVAPGAMAALVKCVAKVAMASAAAKSPLVKHASMAAVKVKAVQKVRTAVKAAVATVAMRLAARHPLQMQPLWACPLR